MSTPPAVQPLDRHTLRQWPLPPLDSDVDKEARGRILVVAGSREIPGAAVLAATAGLRAGAGKLVIATAASVAQAMAFALPEARVIALPETPAGGLAARGIELLQKTARGVAAAVVGPGLMDEPGCQDFLAAVLALLRGRPVVLDALAMSVAIHGGRFESPVLLTPHAGEMAHLTGRDKAAIDANPQGAVLQAARQWNATVALKGAVTWIATAEGRLWRHEGGNAGLATSGSGDTLAGIIGGLAARGAPLDQACAWGVVAHALAGERLARKTAPVGYLARELAEEVPAVLHGLAG